MVLFVTGTVAFRTSPLQYLRPLPAWSGSAFGSKPEYAGPYRCMKSGLQGNPAHHLMGYPSSTRWWGKYEQDESEQLKHIALVASRQKAGRGMDTENGSLRVHANPNGVDLISCGSFPLSYNHNGNSRARSDHHGPCRCRRKDDRRAKWRL